jgi:hypothetical protein
MTSNDNDKSKLEKEAESSMARKRLWLSDDDANDDDSSDSLEEEIEEEEEVFAEEMSMNQLNTSEEKLFAKRDHDMIFSNDGDTTLCSLEPHTPESHRRSDEDSSDEDDDDFWM